MLKEIKIYFDPCVYVELYALTSNTAALKHFDERGKKFELSRLIRHNYILCKTRLAGLTSYSAFYTTLGNGPNYDGVKTVQSKAVDNLVYAAEKTVGNRRIC